MSGNITGSGPTHPPVGRDAMDELEDLGAESAGDPGSDNSPRSNPANTAVGGSLNSGPNDPGFEATEELASRGQATEQPGRDAESGVPRADAERTAPGDNLG